MIAGWWYTRSSQIRWAVRFFGFCYLFSAWAVSQAAVARAERPGSEVTAPVVQMMGWSGLSSVRGIPAASLHLITVSDHRGGESVFDAARAVFQVFKDIVTLSFPAGVLTAMVSMFLMFMTLIVWLFKFAQSMVWMQWLAALFAPLFLALVEVVARLQLIPACLTVGLSVGAVVWMLGNKGKGAAMMASAFAVTLVTLVAFSDPVGDLYSDDGLFAAARHIAFQLGEAAARNGALPGASGAAQLGDAMKHLVTSLEETPLMLINFGHVLGPECTGPYAHALGQADAVAALDTLRVCDGGAVTYAEHLSWQSLAAVGLFGFLSAVIGVFIAYVVVAQVGVGFKAGAYALSVIPASGPGAIPGPTQRVWVKIAISIGLHVLEWFAYTVFVSVVGLLIMAAAGDEFAARTGINDPVVQFMIAAILSAAACWAFWKITGSFRPVTVKQITKCLTGPVTATQAAMVSSFQTGMSAADWTRNWLNAPHDSKESGAGDLDDAATDTRSEARDPDVPSLPDKIPETVVATRLGQTAAGSRAGGGSSGGAQAATVATVAGAAAAPEAVAARTAARHGATRRSDSSASDALVSQQDRADKASSRLGGGGEVCGAGGDEAPTGTVNSPSVPVLPEQNPPLEPETGVETLPHNRVQR